MMEIIITEKAGNDLLNLDKRLQKYFIKHIDKLPEFQKRKHMKFGMPYFVKQVTRQARLVYNVRKDKIYVLRCFKTHKEYEKWYQSFK
ncbi:hypothetical protein J7J90_01930 [Candidatus Micrarchaeota archaeon]|nr:hypothetical protein [Candidatus Micrarchaeota archaeon]